MRLRIGILAACTTLAVATSPAVAGEGWSDDEVLAAAGALAKQLAMPDEQLFGGDYDGSSVSATMGGAGTSVGPAFHKVYLIGASSGASANAGGGKLTITVGR